MIVCVCKAVSDRHIHAAVNHGASCLRDITRELKVGTCCGKCLPEARNALLAGLAQRKAATETTLSQRIESATNTLFGNAASEFAV
jgi:bacterioferritin-associated ferredoxin